MSTVRHLHGVITDSVGGTSTVDGTVTVYDVPTVKFSNLPTSATVGGKVSGQVLTTHDADVTATLQVTVDGTPVAVAADGTFSFTA